MNAQGNLTEVVRARVDRDLADALARQAVKEGREVSQLVRNTLRAAMVAAGQLSEVIERA
jgi:hypothetical protein